MRPDMLCVEIVRLPHAAGIPEYASAGAAGMDLCAALPEEQPLDLEPGDRRLVPCGIRIAVPEGWEAQVRSRSGHALKAGLVVANSPGTIDSDYRGEVGAIMVNTGSRAVRINRGLKIAQLVFAAVPWVVWQPVPALDRTERGEAGFGSTGG